MIEPISYQERVKNIRARLNDLSEVDRKLFETIFGEEANE